MGKVIPLRPEFAPRSKINARPVKVKGVWHQWLGTEPGRKPTGHPPLARGPRGKALLQVGQVWVERHTGLLWVVSSFEKGRAHPSYPHDVELTPYRGRYQRKIAEMTLRQTMQVWEDAEEEANDLAEAFGYAARFNRTSPWRGQEQAVENAQSFFGRDEFGNREGLIKQRLPKPKGGPPRKNSVWRTRSGRSTLTVTRLSRSKGDKLWVHVSYHEGGFGVMEYDAWRWYERYVPDESSPLKSA